MKVSLIDYTGKGAMYFNKLSEEYNNDTEYAIDILIFTKSTRLTMHPGLLQEIKNWPHDKKMAELEYMANTIPSSWEFVDYTFMVEGVSRGFTHQFVRSRQFSFAQQTMRVLDVSGGLGWDYLTGPTINRQRVTHEGMDGEFTDATTLYEDEMASIGITYKSLIAGGVAIEDARGILPTNILTNIVGKCNMRTFVELVRKRSSPRTQSEYRDVLEAMKAAVREVHPWIDLFIERTFDKAANELCEELMDFQHDSINTDEGAKEWRTKMIKLVDQMRGQS